jgi:hypothetical protein
LDFLNVTTDNDVVQNAQFIITNPPWSQNKLFITKAFQLGIKFAFLIKSEVQGTKYFRDLVLKYPCCAIPNAPRCKFLNVQTGKPIQVGSTFWLIGNFRPPVFTDIGFHYFPFVYLDKQEEKDSEFDSITLSSLASGEGEVVNEDEELMRLEAEFLELL